MDIKDQLLNFSMENMTNLKTKAEKQVANKLRLVSILKERKIQKINKKI